VLAEKITTEWIAEARGGRPRAVARLITQAESNPTAARAIVRALYAHTGQAHLVGITGPPGSGKSSLVNELAKTFRQRGRRVGIVAVDPSSPFTGGALLGDRVRMRDLAGDAGIFVRSMASRGSLGGLTRATSAVVRILDAAGYDLILIETVGAGQAEVDIATATHTAVVLEAPGMGDDVQSIKAGILEIADVLVVNKADLPGANRTIKSLEMMLHLALPAGDIDTDGHHGALDGMVADEGQPRGGAGWAVPVLSTTATTGAGVEALADAIDRHRAHMQAGDGWAARELAMSRAEIERLLHARLIDHLAVDVSAAERAALMTAVVERRLDPYSAADRLFDAAGLSEAAKTRSD
jgi:LAO/AO transport system kinase